MIRVRYRGWQALHQDLLYSSQQLEAQEKVQGNDDGQQQACRHLHQAIAYHQRKAYKPQHQRCGRHVNHLSLKDEVYRPVENFGAKRKNAGGRAKNTDQQVAHRQPGKAHMHKNGHSQQYAVNDPKRGFGIFFSHDIKNTK